MACPRRGAVHLPDAAQPRPTEPRRLRVYRPNSRCISQPSSPAAASGRTDVRVGAGRPATPVVDICIGIGVGAEGGLTCEEACTRFENVPAGCEFGSGAGVTP